MCLIHVLLLYTFCVGSFNKKISAMKRCPVSSQNYWNDWNLVLNDFFTYGYEHLYMGNLVPMCTCIMYFPVAKKKIFQKKRITAPILNL